MHACNMDIVICTYLTNVSQTHCQKPFDKFSKELHLCTIQTWRPAGVQILRIFNDWCHRRRLAIFSNTEITYIYIKFSLLIPNCPHLETHSYWLKIVLINWGSQSECLNSSVDEIEAENIFGRNGSWLHLLKLQDSGPIEILGCSQCAT